jgi:hypothetical protein
MGQTALGAQHATECQADEPSQRPERTIVKPLDAPCSGGNGPYRGRSLDTLTHAALEVFLSGNASLSALEAAML